MSPRRPQVRSLRDPDELTPFDHGESRYVEIGGLAIGRSTHDVGWHWAEHIGPVVGTHSCQVHHVGLIVSGRVRVRWDDGTELEAGPDDAIDIPPGHDAWTLGDEPAVMIDVLGARGWARPPLPGERVLTTLAFTDIVDSTRRAAAVGDVRWRDIVSEHYESLRGQLDRFGGVEIATTGDGMLARFDSPGRAARFGAAAAALAEADGLAIRVGLHTGEVELVGDDARGVAVHIANRVMSAAGPGEVLVSAATRGLLPDAELSIDDRGEHELKGVEGRHRLWAVRPQ